MKSSRPDASLSAAFRAALARVDVFFDLAGETHDDVRAIENIASRVLSDDAGHVKANAVLGHIMLQTGRAAEAIPHLARAYAARPDDVQLGAFYADALFTQGKYAECIAPATAAAEHFPDDFTMRFVLGHALIRTGRAAEGLDHIAAVGGHMEDIMQAYPRESAELMQHMVARLAAPAPAGR